MPTIKVANLTASSENELEGRKFSVLRGPALVSLYASAAAAGNKISMSVGDREILVNADVNIEASADVIDTDRDGILFQERVPAGKLFMDTTVVTGLNFLLVIEPIG